ncbi:MAG: ribonuclease P [Candidatus Thermoplasmatota archaeon]|nr:ribonuclease P [Candidatus Thermoplasmatota archaeon]
MERRGRGKKKPIIREAAADRIETLYSQAFTMARKGELDLARRYLYLARKIGMRYTVRVPKRMKRSTCKGCMAPMLPGITSRTRVRDGRRIITCLECGHVMRYPFKDEGHDNSEGEI